MKLDFATDHAGGGAADLVQTHAVRGEADRLVDVLLCGPSHLETVPCCSVTRESMRNGFVVAQDEAQRQHAALRQVLERHGVRCHAMPATPELPDLCFTRDAGVMTPWGFVALKPAMAHRSVEVDHLVRTLSAIGVRPVRRITEGTIEGGDVCVARPGLLVLGLSGERTSTAGAEAFAASFVQQGWDVLYCSFDPHFLHLDTMFCMLDANTALACTDVLDDGFLAALAARDITLIPVSYKEARRLGCNVVSLDGRTILMNAAAPQAAERVRAAGFLVEELDVSQFAACGGGLHCLTLPLRRLPARG
ncbi:dimethylarginine dimethylaminohydrolase family protein [Novosphingobium soli]|uniref:arginine deiminase n=1 Tax=Novosphingobium soli TaxID=574956 RepID=A0ABV6CZL2_9SPHN